MCYVWSNGTGTEYKMPPENFDVYLNALLAFTRHDSQMVSYQTFMISIVRTISYKVYVDPLSNLTKATLYWDLRLNSFCRHI